MICNDFWEEKGQREVGGGGPPPPTPQSIGWNPGHVIPRSLAVSQLSSSTWERAVSTAESTRHWISAEFKGQHVIGASLLGALKDCSNI